MSPTPDDPTQAQAWISGEAPDQTVDFYIPRGNQGIMGPQGPVGPSLLVGNIETVTGPAAAPTIGPQGVQGPKGDPGGLIDPLVMPSGVDLNNYTTSGTYRLVSTDASTSLNAPRNGTGGHLMVLRGATTVITQIFYPLSATLQRGHYVRSLVGTWSPWYFVAPTRLDQSAGRAIYQWDETNNREQMIYGDTGWRDVAPLSGTAAWIRLRRISNIVHVWVADWANGTSIDIVGLPAGFQTGTNSIASYWGARSNAPSFVSVNGPSSLLQASSVSASGLTAYVSYPTVNSWPTSLPGTAHAVIPNL